MNLHELRQGVSQTIENIGGNIWPSPGELDALYEQMHSRDLSDPTDFNLGISPKAAIAIFLVSIAGTVLGYLQDQSPDQPPPGINEEFSPGGRVIPSTLVFSGDIPAPTEIPITKQGGVFDKNGLQIWGGPLSSGNVIDFDGQPVWIEPIVDKEAPPSNQQTLQVSTKFMNQERTRVWNLAVPAHDIPLPVGTPETAGPVEMPSDLMENYLREHSPADVSPLPVAKRDTILKIGYWYLGIKRENGETAVYIDNNGQAKLFLGTDLADMLCPVDILNREFPINTIPPWLEPENSRFRLPKGIRVLPLEGEYNPDPYYHANILRLEYTADEKGIPYGKKWWELDPPCGITNLIPDQL